MNAMDASLICRALGDTNRIQIVELLTGGEMCACRLLEHFQITQPTLSHHMKILCDSGIVVGRKEGKWMHYCVSAAGIERAQEYLFSLKNDKEDNRNE
ncbi:MAG: ArsR/SmtB family transcription factor [Huintestinicola sp.]